MQTIAINENNDIYLDNTGNLAIKQNLEAIGNIVINKSQTIKNELLYSNKGIDFFNTIFANPSYPDLFQNELTNQLMDTESVEDINNFQAQTNKNTFNYKLDVQTEFGKVLLNG